jgi:hypothetical protein
MVPSVGARENRVNPVGVVAKLRSTVRFGLPTRTSGIATHDHPSVGTLTSQRFFIGLISGIHRIETSRLLRVENEHVKAFDRYTFPQASDAESAWDSETATAEVTPEEQP